MIINISDKEVDLVSGGCDCYCWNKDATGSDYAGTASNWVMCGAMCFQRDTYPAKCDS